MNTVRMFMGPNAFSFQASPKLRVCAPSEDEKNQTRIAAECDQRGVPLMNTFTVSSEKGSRPRL